MSGLLSRTNKYAGACFVCATKVRPSRGYLIARDDLEELGFADITRAWAMLCNSRKCVASVVGKDAVDEADRRCIDADGRVWMTYDEEALPFLRALGSWDKGESCWRASPHRRDRDQVIRVAAKLGLAVDPAFAEYEDPAPVREAVARARAIPTIREYQVEGVRWLAYRALDDVKSSGFNKSDRARGFLLADDQGVGKSCQTLEALRDDEALLVVCNSSAKEVWPREARKWRPDRFDKITILQGEESFRWPENTRELVVLNYDILPFTAAQIEDEIEHGLAKLDGHLGDADHKTKWKRKDVKSLRKQLARAMRPAKRLEASGALTATPGRHAYFLALSDVVEGGLPAKVERVEAALARARERKPVDTGPGCPVLLVGDELHYVENGKALRTQRWRHLTRYARRVGGLTGTPFEADPLKGWGLLTSACANPFNWPGFLHAFNGSKGLWGGIEFARNPSIPGSTALGSVIVEPGTTEQLQRVLLRRAKEEVLPELPAKVFVEIPVPLNDKIRKQLDEITAAHASELLEGELPPFEALSAVLKALSKHCIPTLLDVVAKHESEGRPLVVFASNHSPIEALSKRKGWFAAYGSRCYGGKNIGEIQDKFQAGEGVGVAGTEAIAESITLTRASNVVQVMPFMRRKTNRQAYDRCHRFGQTDTVVVEMLVPDHVLVHHILALLVAKDQFVDDVLDGESTPALDQAARFVDEPEDQWRERAERQTQARKEQAERDRRRALLKREKELTALAEREVTPKKSEQRAKLRAERLTAANESAAKVVDFSADKGTVQAALAHMLARCDGAREKDDAGFNAPDSAVARWLAPGVDKGSRYAVASAAAILKRYPRQLGGEFPSLFG